MKVKKEKLRSTEDLPLLDEDEAEEGIQPDVQERDERAEEIQDIVTAQAEEALKYFEDHLEPDYVEATNYYFGRPFGNEEEGRSKVIDTVLRDTVRQQLPSLMRIFLGPEKSVEFRGRKGVEDSALAEQSTDYIEYVTREDNDAFLIFHSLFKDFLLRRAAVKWYWDETYRVEESEHTGLSMTQAAMLGEDPEVEILVDSVEEVPGPDGEPRINLRLRRTKRDGCERYVAIPPEELIYTPGARTFREATMVGHVRYVPRDELIQMDIDEDDIDEAQSERREQRSEGLFEARQKSSGLSGLDLTETLDESQQPVLYGELYVLVDGDGDGVAERRLFKCIGEGFKITNHDPDGNPGEIVDSIPIASSVMDPEPHSVEGLTDHDLTKDIQLINSQIQREQLNSLGKAVEPTTIIQRGKVNIGDVTNPDVKSIVRVDGDVNTTIREMEHVFVGPHTLPVLEYYEKVLERRVGRNQGTGIDADSLQSATKSAVAAQLTAAQALTEMLAGVFAYTIMKPLFKGLLSLSIQHRSEARTIRLRNQWVEVDPRHWTATMDVHVNVGLGHGMPEDRIILLKEIYADQKEQMVAQSPLVTWKHLRYTLSKLLMLGGWTNDGDFYATLEEVQQAEEQQQQQPPPPDPAMMLVEIEKQKMEYERQHAEAKIELEREKMMREDDRARDKMARDHVRAMFEIKMKYAAQAAADDVDDDIERDRIAQDADLQREQQERDMTIKAAEMLQNTPAEMVEE